jgi:hypothetical protein
MAIGSDGTLKGRSISLGGVVSLARETKWFTAKTAFDFTED